MKTIKQLCLLLFALCMNALFSQSPNVVIIIADDMGWSQVSTGLTNLNNPSDFYETPTLETLASEGIAFPHAYVNGANCAPTRAALLSGQYASRPHNNIWAVDNLNRGGSGTLLVGPSQGLPSGIDELPVSAVTIAETMKTAGYATVHLGKFHVGENESTNSTNNAATDQGFDVNYGGGTKGNPGNYFASSSAPYTFHANIGPELDVYADPYTEAESQMLAGNSSLTGTKKHVTDAMADAAIDWMEANKNSPFFVHFSNFAIHGPFDTGNARPDLVAKYQAKPPSQMGHNSVGQAAIAEGMDQTIGRLVDYLKTTDDPRNPGFKLSQNTLVYFISDNGGARGTDDNGPLKGMKGELHEGGIRSVTLAWSEASWLANKGTVNHTPIVAFDLYPTLAEMAGASLPGGGYAIDGASQWQMLTNGTAMTREAIYWHFPGYLVDSNRDQRPQTVIRKGDYKLIHSYETASYQMYNLITDMSETTNLLAGNPDQATLIIANDLSTDMQNHLISINAPLPTYRSNGQTVPLPYIISTEPGGGGGGLCEAPAGYEAYWNFDTTNGANDASGNNHNPNPINGTLSFDSTDFAEGDQSAVFSGSVDIQYSSGSFLTNALTTRSYTVWLKPTALSGLQVIMDEGGGNQGLGVRLNGTNLEAIVRSGTTNLTQISTPYPTDGAWHHVAFVYDGGATSMKLYIDGVEVASDNSALSSVATHTGIGGIGGVIGGKDPFGEASDSYFTGKMDGYAVYNGALTLAQVEEAACLSSVVADAGPDVSICEGDSTTLTASGGDTYLWSTGATTASITVSPGSTTTYTVTAFVGGNSDDDDVIVTVNPLPTADAGADVTICDGDTTILTASGGDTYLWSTGATTASINVNPSSTTTYTVTVTTNGCSANDDVIVTVNPAPTADAGADVTICEGDTTTLTASGGDTYLWSTGATTASIDVSPTSTTTYTVTVTTNGCSANDDVIVTVNPLPAADAGADVSICEGDTTTLTASGGDTYLWSTGATTASIDVSPTSTTTYTVTVTTNGCSSNDDVIVTVNAIPVANAGADVTICEGDTTTLTASGGDTYLWSTGATTASIDVSPTLTTTYTVTVTTNGCSANDDVEVTVNAAPTADAGPDVAICEGDTTTLTASGGGTYLWSTGATTASINVSPGVTTTYTVTVTNNGCSSNDDVIVTVNSAPTADAGPDVTICDGDTTTLTASGGDTYLWSTGATTASIDVSPTSTTVYTVTVSYSGCGVSDNDSVTVTVNPVPTADAGADVTICEGDTTTLTALGGDTYLWNTGATTASINVSPTATTTYTVTVTTNGCSSNDDVIVTVNPLPAADAGADVSICEGDTTTLTASGGDTYLWSTGATTASIDVTPGSTTTYTVTATSNGCSANDNVIVTVNAIPVANAGADVTICEGDSTTLTASGGDTYLWSTGDTTASISVSPGSTTTYTVTAISDGCSSNDDVVVTVNPTPTADAGSDVTITEGDSITLTASGGGTYLWSTGATTASITVSPGTTTTYSVTVTQNGCSDVDDVIVTVESSGCIYTLINSEGFESGWGIWNDGGSDARRSSNDAIYATTGTYCIRLRDDTSTSVMTTDNLDLSIYEELTVDFGYYARSMDNSSEDFWLQISTNGGSSYTTVEEWNRDDEFVNNAFYTDQVVIPGPFTSNTRLRFRCDASGNQDWVYIDDVVINGCTSSGAAKVIEAKETAKDDIADIDDESDIISAVLYPNPFNNKFTIKIESAYNKADVSILNVIGQSVYFKSFSNKETIEISTEDFQVGQYIVRMDIDGETIYKRVIKD
ncbi:sulfatase-like hydrolase/transferase [Seonamhaeicola sp.]|uniref:sulfatase-like hydrolase/transferase n=1 Tax=Seonamhaeicola sp. TaxID=1912245 RepID=UPI0026024986|nr:sulfatase-like hydrolase/transferase [Seonamhaeicola sp.]